MANIDEQSSDGIHIRNFTDADASSVIELVLGIQNNEFGLNLSIEDQQDLANVGDYYFKRNGTFFVADRFQKEIVGTIGLLRLSREIAVMKKFFVLSCYRGRKVGISARLYDAFISFAKSNGIETIVLDTPSVATRSHKFYLSVGFTEISRAELPMPYDFPERDTLFFRLTLPST